MAHHIRIRSTYERGCLAREREWFFSRLRLKLTAEKRSLISALKSAERINFELTFAGKYGKSECHSTKKKEKIVLRVVFRSFTKMARRTWHWKHTFFLLISAFREGNEERSRLDKATDSFLPWLEQIPQTEQSVPNIPQGVRKCLAREWSLNWVASTFEIAIEKTKKILPSIRWYVLLSNRMTASAISQDRAVP